MRRLRNPGRKAVPETKEARLRQSLKLMLEVYWGKGDGEYPPEFIRTAAELCDYKLNDMKEKENGIDAS